MSYLPTLKALVAISWRACLRLAILFNSSSLVIILTVVSAFLGHATLVTLVSHLARLEVKYKCGLMLFYEIRPFDYNVVLSVRHDHYRETKRKHNGFYRFPVPVVFGENS